MSYKNHYFQRV